MKKITIILLAALFLSGCVTYEFQKPASSGSQGYLVSYDGKPIMEYTVGKEKSLPDLTLAKERFKRRRQAVEYYYKKAGQIEPRFKEFFWDAPAMFVDFLGGILRWPFIAAADYKYNHNPKYKERMDQLDEEREALEKARINNLKEKLNAYINEDLAKEDSPQARTGGEGRLIVSHGGVPAVAPQTPTVVAAPVTAIPQPITPQPVEIKAVIIAKPAKGYSPLTIKFSGQKSYSKPGKIISYLWDFGDGDTSTKKNPENTYWSATYGSRNFIATLTVKDEAGNSSSATTIIEVITK